MRFLKTPRFFVENAFALLQAAAAKAIDLPPGQRIDVTNATTTLRELYSSSGFRGWVRDFDGQPFFTLRSQIANFSACVSVPPVSPRGRATQRLTPAHRPAFVALTFAPASYLSHAFDAAFWVRSMLSGGSR